MLQFDSWEYDFNSTLVDPLGAAITWIRRSVDSGQLGWSACQLINTGRGTCVKSAAEVGRWRRSRWLMGAMTRSRRLLLVLGVQPPESFRAGFTPRDSMPPGSAQLGAPPWDLPPKVIPDFVRHLERGGGGTLLGHDGQYLLTAQPVIPAPAQA